VPKKRYLTALDVVMNAGLLVQLVSCAMVFFNSDLPHQPEGEVRSHLYEVTDENVARVEALYLQYVIGGWIAFNFALVPIVWLLEIVGRIFPHLREMRVHTQDWLLSALGQATGKLPSGKYSTYRMGEEITEKHYVLHYDGGIDGDD
jgi:hypothetical protein